MSFVEEALETKLKHPTVRKALTTLRKEAEAEINHLLHRDLSAGISPGLEMEREYGIYKITSRLKSIKSLKGKIDGHRNARKEWNDSRKPIYTSLAEVLSDPKFDEGELDKEDNAKALAVTLTHYLPDLIGVRVVCSAPRQKHRVHARLHRCARSARLSRLRYPHFGGNWAMIEQARHTGPDIKASTELPSPTEISPYSLWDYYNPPPVYLRCNDFIEITPSNPYIVGVGHEEWTDEELDNRVGKAFTKYQLNCRTYEALGYVAKINTLGYSTMQTNLLLVSDRDRNIDDRSFDGATMFEIQVRTTMEDAFAEPEHKLVYKGILSQPAQNGIQTLGALLVAADDALQNVFDARDEEMSEGESAFVLQQSGMIASEFESPAFRRDQARLHWLFRDGRYLAAFMHIEEMKRQVGRYTQRDAAEGPIEEQQDLSVHLLLEQTLALLFLGYVSQDKDTLRACADIYKSIRDKHGRSDARVKFTCAYRGSLASYLIHTLFWRKGDDTSDIREAWELAREVQELLPQEGKSGKLKLKPDDHSYVDLWEITVRRRMLVDAIGQIGVGEAIWNAKQIIHALKTPERKPDGWLLIWAENVRLYTSLSSTDPDQMIGTSFKELIEAARVKSGKLDSFLKAMDGLADQNSSATMEESLQNCRIALQSLHSGHLKVLDTLWVAGAYAECEQEFRNLLDEHTLELIRQGFLPQRAPAATELGKGRDARLKELRAYAGARF